MLRFKTLIAATIAAAQPALAATPTQYGEGEGERFEYTTELRANGFVHIAGVVLGSRQPFVLDVSPTGNVGGYFGDVPVEYHVSKKVRDAVVAQIDQGQAVASASLPN
jgi:hypothetical protein